MAFDFPNSPTNGQTFTPAGGPTYTYDSAGTKWTVSSISATIPITTSTYTPGTAGILNVAAITAYACQYSRVGSFVVVSGRIDIDPITASTATALAITLPVASDFTLTEQLGGTFVSIGIQGQSGGIIADVTSNNARFDYTPASAVNQANPFILAYQVL